MLLKKIYNYITSTCNIFLSVSTKEFIERIFIGLALVGFFINLLLVFFSNQIPEILPNVLRLDKGYLATIYTPFAVILLYEVFLMISSIPKSIDKSMVRQYEVSSLIVLWRVFKDGSKFDNIQTVDVQNELFLKIILDLVTSVALFALVALFYRTIINSPKEKTFFNGNGKYKIYKDIKNLITVVLLTFFFVLLIYNGTIWVTNLIQGNSSEYQGIQNNLLSTLFTGMIIGDIFIVFLSYIFMNKYETIFRNAAFIISAILIRFSINAETPYNLILAILAPIIGIVVSFIYSKIEYIKVKSKN